MLTLKQIKKAINDVLIAKFPAIPVQSNDVKEGFARPSFFVRLEDITRDSRLYVAERSMTVRIYFFPSDRNEYAIELLDTQDSLEQSFDLTLTVEDRHITIGQTSAVEVDGVLQFEFDFSYLESKIAEPTEPLMAEIEFGDGV